VTLIKFISKFYNPKKKSKEKKKQEKKRETEEKEEKNIPNYSRRPCGTQSEHLYKEIYVYL
jgi:hypothetical protein